MYDLSVILSNNIKKYRNLSGLSQEELAEKAGVNLGTVNRLENRRQFPSQRTLNKLIKYFNIEPYQLFIDDTKPFDKERYIETVYPLIMKDIKKRMRSTDLL